MPKFTVSPGKIGPVDVVDFYALTSRKDGELIAYLPCHFSTTSRGCLASYAVGALIEAASDTQSMIEDGDSSFYLAENDGDHQPYFDQLVNGLALSTIEMDGAVIGYIRHGSKYLLAVLEALNGEKITLPDSPTHVGTWVAAVTPQQEFIKWGKDGDTTLPFPPDDKDAVKCAKTLAKSSIHKNDVFYILHVFSNGQMKTYEFES